MRVLTMAVVLAALAGAAAAQETVAVRFDELSMGYDANDPEALPRTRAALAAEFPDFFEEPLPSGPLRSDLAQTLSRDQVLALFARGAREPSEQAARWIALSSGAGSPWIRRSIQ